MIEIPATNWFRVDNVIEQGTESVKEFLVAKLKDTEAALKRSLDEKGLTLRQSASDQEVISFLDSRTQVLHEHRLRGQETFPPYIHQLVISVSRQICPNYDEQDNEAAGCALRCSGAASRKHIEI